MSNPLNIKTPSIEELHEVLEKIQDGKITIQNGAKLLGTSTPAVGRLLKNHNRVKYKTPSTSRGNDLERLAYHETIRRQNEKIAELTEQLKSCRLGK